jgi:response regulator RpfG family c-di-GMP phosphodiesterase
MLQRILAVDDEQSILGLITASLDGRYLVETTDSAREGLRRLRSDTQYSAIIVDMVMPGMNGVELLCECEQIAPLTSRIILTGDPRRQTLVDAINRGRVFQFVSKPVVVPALRDVMDAAIRFHEQQKARHELLDTTLSNSVNLLLEVLCTLDPHSFELSQRVRRSMRVFGRAVHVPAVWELEMAAALARIGTAALPKDLLTRFSTGGPLSPRERKLLENVPTTGWEMLRVVPRMERVAEIIRYQAKHFDGSGHPHDTVAGENIPFGARILKVFNDRIVLEVEGIAKKQAHEIMKARRGVYDPIVLAASFQCFPNYILSSMSATTEVQMLIAQDLRPGQTLVAEVRSVDGLLLVAAGTQLTQLIVERIDKHVTLGNVKGPFCVQDTAPEPVTPVSVAASMSTSVD